MEQETTWYDSIRGDVTWFEQFGYIYLCIKEIVKIFILRDRYRPGV